MADRGAIRWLPRQEKRLRDAVSKYNAAVTRMARSGKYDSVPNYTSFEEEKARIYTRDQLYRREKQLGRILVKNNPGATNVVEAGGIKVPKYLKDEIRYTKQVRDEETRRRREELFADFVGMTNMQKATVMTNKNLFVDDEYEFDYDYPYYEDITGDDWMMLLSLEYPEVALYADQYLAVWDELGGDGELGDIISRFMEENPEALVDIFDSGDTRVEIEYIYPDKPTGGTSSKRGYKYDRLSAFQDPLEERQSKVLEFWREMEREYLD